MFGLSMGEIVMLLLVGIVVVGPKKLPTMMRTAGQWITRLRRMSTDLRSQSGIDDLIRHEGLEKEIQQLRSLSRVNVIDTFITPALTVTPVAAAVARSAAGASADALPAGRSKVEVPTAPLREREYPAIGCDAGGAVSEDTILYHAPPEPVSPSKAAPAEEAPPQADAAKDDPTPAEHVA